MNKKRIKIHIFLTTLIILVFFVLPVSAQELGYTPLTDIGVTTGVDGGVNLTSYLKQMFNIVVGLAIILAVLMIVIGGIQYMTSVSSDGKSRAKGRILAAIFGLFIAITPILLLNTINPDLINIDITKGIIKTQQENITPQQSTENDYTQYKWVPIRVWGKSPECFIPGSWCSTPVTIDSCNVVGPAWSLVNKSFCEGSLEPNVEVDPNEKWEKICCAIKGEKGVILDVSEGEFIGPI